MNMYKVEINISDQRLLRLACYYLDNKNILEYMFQLRTKNSLLNRHIDSAKFDKWIKDNKHSIILSKEVREQIDRRLEESERPDDNWQGQSLEDELNKKITLLQMYQSSNIQREIEYIKKKFLVSEDVAWMVLKATVCNKVNEKDLQNKQASEKNADFLVNDYEISIDPTIYRKSKKQELKRDRDWYWKKVVGETYLEISQHTKERGKISPEDFENNVKQGIRRYKEFLGVQNSLL